MQQGLKFSQVKDALANILSNLPAEWKGTTFANSNLLGREQFSKNLANLILEKGSGISTNDLVEIGNAEDYLRVSSNISTVLEFTLAAEAERDVTKVYTFSSDIMEVLAVLLAMRKPAHLYVGENGQSPISEETNAVFKQIGCQLEIIQSEAKQQNGDVIVLSTLDDFKNSAVDGVIRPGILYINNSDKISSAEIMVIRKRMSTPFTTPFSLQKLHSIAAVKTEAEEIATQEAQDATLSHLQQLSGATVDPQNYPVLFTAGLPAICSIYMTLIQTGGADIVMASTAYGGSSQLTDLITNNTGNLFKKHKFDITGKNDIIKAVKTSLDGLAANSAALLPTTMLFIEVPTNPDMKVPDLAELVKVATEYKNQTKKELVLMVDTTFSPGSKVLAQIKAVSPDLTSMVFISLSKSVSRGMTTAGTLVAGDQENAKTLLSKIRKTAANLDTTARKEQVLCLSKWHIGVEERCEKSYNNARVIGDALKKAVRENCENYEMEINFPTPDNAKLGFTSSTFSFNLPVLKNGTTEQNAALAQKFVDQITQYKEVKPCVSFGQDNNLVYATVPATSTQGAIAQEDKAKQAIGGVQLVRLSFPPTCDTNLVSEIFTKAVVNIYKEKALGE